MGIVFFKMGTLMLMLFLLLDIFLLFICRIWFELDLGFDSRYASWFCAFVLPEHADDAAEIAELVVLAEEHTAHGAAVCLLLVMDHLVALAVVVGGEGALAAVAGEGPLPSVHSLVLVVVAAAQETLATNSARERPVSIMELHVSGQLCQRRKSFTAHTAYVLPQPSEHLWCQQQRLHQGLQRLFELLSFSLTMSCTGYIYRFRLRLERHRHGS